MGSHEDPHRGTSTMADGTPASTAHASNDLSSINEKPPSSSEKSADTTMAPDAPIFIDNTSHEVQQGDETSTDEYPKGLPLLFIVLAIILGIFLASLDMVSP